MKFFQKVLGTFGLCFDINVAFHLPDVFLRQLRGGWLPDMRFAHFQCFGASLTASKPEYASDTNAQREAIRVLKFWQECTKDRVRAVSSFVLEALTKSLAAEFKCQHGSEALSSFHLCVKVWHFLVEMIRDQHDTVFVLDLHAA